VSGLVYRAASQTAVTGPLKRVPLVRKAKEASFGRQANHGYTISHQVYGAMVNLFVCNTNVL
jgi:hypothetical protein